MKSQKVDKKTEEQDVLQDAFYLIEAYKSFLLNLHSCSWSS